MKLLFISGFLLLFSSARTQVTQKPFGFVFNASTRNAVENASVENRRTGEVVQTNEQGRFLFQTGLLSSDSLQISAIGFRTAQPSYADFLGNNKTYALNAKEILLKELVVKNNVVHAYQLISQLDIKLRAVNNTQEALRLVPGLFIGQHSGGGKAEQIFLRGFDLDHGTDISISVDGMPVNMVSHAHGQGYADLHFVIPELIENVDFKKGTYYPEKGNFTTTGYVDFRTINVLPVNSLKIEAGQFNTFRGVGLFNLLNQKAALQQQSAYVAAEAFYSDGYFDHPQKFRRYNLFGKYNGRLNQQNHLTVSASTFTSTWNASGQIPERAVLTKHIGFFGAIDSTEGGHTDRANFNAVLTSTLTNGGVIKNQIYFSHYQFKLFSNFTFFKEDPVNGDQIRQKESRNLFGYNGSYGKTAYAGTLKVTSEAGINLRFDRTKNSELSRTKDRSILTHSIQLGDIKESNLSGYFSETFAVSPTFSINTGLRYDFFVDHYIDHLAGNAVGKTTAGIVSPKLNFYYQPTAKTQLYFTNGKGFHSNDTRVVVAQKGLAILPAAYGSDLGVVSKLTNSLFMNVAIWHLYLQQEFVYVGDEGVVEPSGKTRRFGLDLSLRYQPVPKLFFDVDLNYARARGVDDPIGQNYLPLAPAFTTTGGMTYKSQKHFSASLRYRYMADRPANEDYSVVAKGYFLSDLFLNYTKKKYEIGMTIQNLFDARWKETQFDTESRLQNEPVPVSEIHFIPGTPFFLKAMLTFFF